MSCLIISLIHIFSSVFFFYTHTPTCTSAQCSRFNTTVLLPLFITIKLLYNSNERRPHVIYMKWLMRVPDSCQRSNQTKFYFLRLGTMGRSVSPRFSYPITSGSTRGNWLQHWLFSIPVGWMNNWPFWCLEFNTVWKHQSTVISPERPVLCSLVEHADSNVSHLTIKIAIKACCAFYNFPIYIIVLSLVSTE